MDIKILATGSSGNCYLVSSDNSKLMIECGIGIKQIQKHMQHRVTQLDGCLVTHEHMDHSKSVKDLVKLGIDCYMSKGTAEGINVSSHRIKILKKYDDTSYYKQVIGDFLITPFNTVHDVNEPLGFVIEQVSTKEVLVFITDTAYIRYKLPAMDYLMVECNYVKRSLDENVLAEYLNINLRNRIVNNHLSLETLIKLLGSSDLNKLKKIYVLHLSDTNSDEAQIKNEIAKVTGKEIVVC